MPYFIATVWTMAHDESDGPQPWYGRQVIRQWADTPEQFRKDILAEDANDECIIGPIGLSKDQRT